MVLADIVIPAIVQLERLASWIFCFVQPKHSKAQQRNSLCWAFLILLALMSRSCIAPHSLQIHALIRKLALPFGLLAGIFP